MKIKNCILGTLLVLNINIVHAEEQVDAIIDWAQRVDLTIPVNGVVEKVSVNTGQIVKKGQVLVELDKRIFQARLRQAKEKVKSQQASYAEIKRELARAQELYDRTVLSEHELQVAKNNEINSRADLETAKSDLIKAQVDLEYSALVAPFDSIILKRNVEVGKAIINQDTYDTLITLASSEKYLAKAKLPSEKSELVHIGQEVKVITTATTYSAKVVAIEFGFDKAAGESTLVVLFSSQDKKLHAGSKVKVAY